MAFECLGKVRLFIEQNTPKYTRVCRITRRDWFPNLSWGLNLLKKGRQFPATLFTASRDLSEPETSSSQSTMKDETPYKEMQLKQSANETKILWAIPSSCFLYTSCLFSVWIIRLKALWNEELSTFCLLCKTKITVGTLENTVIFSICLYCFWWRHLAPDLCENFPKDEQRNTSVNWQHVTFFLRDFRLLWAKEEHGKSHMFCQFVHSNAKLHLKARHGQDEILRYISSWHFGEWLKIYM